MSVKLKQIISDTQNAMREDPKTARALFTSSSTLGTGFRSEVSIRNHRLTVDEPAALGGTDSGPNPLELLLAALGTCQEITYRAYATALGIELDRVSVEVTGAVDLRGFFGVDDSVRPGYEKVRAVVTLESSAPAAALQRLCEAVNAHCPVLDVINNPVAVETELRINA